MREREDIYDLIEPHIIDDIKDAIQDSIQTGITPNWVMISPVWSFHLPDDLVEICGLKIWRSWDKLPGNRSVIAIKLNDTSEQKKTGGKE